MTLATVMVGSVGAAVPPPAWSDPHPALQPLAYAAHAAHATGGRQLLAYDDTGDGRVVEVLGDLDAAEHVAVVVPGSGHRLGNFWTSTSPAAPRRNGADLLAEMRRQSPRTGVAVVVWLGYDAPEQVDLVAARSDRAATGAGDLARLTWRLPARASVTLVGHSYGSVVVARAARAARVDDLVVIGSPGMDAASVTDLGTPAAVWAARGPRDPIAFVPSVRIGGVGHDADPTSAGFGARTFATGRVAGHDGYYEPGSESLANIARIAVGRSDQVTSATPTPGEL